MSRKRAKKLVLVLAISILVTAPSMEDHLGGFLDLFNLGVISDQLVAKLQRVPYIRYPAQFNQHLIEAFINLGSKVNAI